MGRGMELAPERPCAARARAVTHARLNEPSGSFGGDLRVEDERFVADVAARLQLHVPFAVISVLGKGSGTIGKVRMRDTSWRCMCR